MFIKANIVIRMIMSKTLPTQDFGPGIYEGLLNCFPHYIMIYLLNTKNGFVHKVEFCKVV